MNSWNQWNAQGVTSGYDAASNSSSSQHAVAATGAYPVGYSYYGQTQALQTPIAGMEGYTSQQWNSLMQQQWQQWSNWQQQYQQWQLQYGDRYKESLNIETTQNVAPPLPSPDMSVPPPPPPPEEGPEPETSRLSGKTNWDQQSKPSDMYYENMPASTVPEEPVKLTDDYRLPPPGFYPSNTPSGVAPNNPQVCLKRSVEDVSKYSHAGSDINSVKKPRTDAYSMDNFSTRSGPTMGNIPLEEQLDNSEFGNKPLCTTGKGPQRVESFVKATADKSGAEKKFEFMYEMWEEQFNNWRKQNIDNPDKAQYLKYEEMWKRWRDQLLQRKELMKKRNRGMSKDGDIASDNPAENPYGNWSTFPTQVAYDDQAHCSVRPRNEDHGVGLNAGGVDCGNNMPLESGYGKLHEIEQNGVSRLVRPELTTTLVSVDKTQGFPTLQVSQNVVPCDSAKYVQEIAGNACVGQPTVDPAKACETQGAISDEPCDMISFIRSTTSTIIPGLDLLSNEDKQKDEHALNADLKEFSVDQSLVDYSGNINESFDPLPGEEIQMADLSINSPLHPLQGKPFDYGLSQEPLHFGPVKNKNVITSARPSYPLNQVSTNLQSIDTSVPPFKPGMHDLHNSQGIKNYQEPLQNMNTRIPLGPNRNIGNQNIEMYNYPQDNFGSAKENWQTNQDDMNYDTSNNSQFCGNFYPNVGEGMQSRQWGNNADLPLQNQGLEPKHNIVEGNGINMLGNVSRNIPEKQNQRQWQVEGFQGRARSIPQGYKGYKSHTGDNQNMSQNPVYEDRDCNTQMYSNQHPFTSRSHGENFMEGRGCGRDGFQKEIGYMAEQNENQEHLLPSNINCYDNQVDPNAFGNEMMWPQKDCTGTMVNKTSSNDVVTGVPGDNINMSTERTLKNNFFGENHFVVDYAHRSASKAIPVLPTSTEAANDAFGANKPINFRARKMQPEGNRNNSSNYNDTFDAWDFNTPNREWQPSHFYHEHNRPLGRDFKNNEHMMYMEENAGPEPWKEKWRMNNRGGRRGGGSWYPLKQRKPYHMENEGTRKEISDIDETQPIPMAPPPPLLSKDIVKILVEDLLSPPGRLTRPSRFVIILRGPPGSGKTFYAKLIKNKEVEMGGTAPRILCLDDYFMVEVDKETTDSETGRKIITKVMEYEYDPTMESHYRDSLYKAFCNTINDGFFSFIVVDCINDRVRHFERLYNYAKQKGFQVYVCQMEVDINKCLKHNIHSRPKPQISNIVKNWENTPFHYTQLDVKSLQLTEAIVEVEMKDASDVEEAKPEETTKEVEEDPVEGETFGTSKWEKMELSGAKLDQLDGLAKPFKEKKPQTMEDWLQLSNEYDKRKPTPGKKTVTWADMKERLEQEKARAIGFVVGQTDWSRMTDPTFGKSALTQTKYI